MTTKKAKAKAKAKAEAKAGAEAGASPLCFAPVEMTGAGWAAREADEIVGW